MDAKPFYTSKTLWGSVATILGLVLPALGIGTTPTEITHAVDSFANVLNDVLTFGGIVYTIYGRTVAKGPLKLKV